MPILTTLAASKALITSITAGAIVLGGGAAAFTNITTVDAPLAVAAPTPSESPSGTPTASPSPSASDTPAPAPTTSPAPSSPAPEPSAPVTSAPAPADPAAGDDEKTGDDVSGVRETKQGDDAGRPAPSAPVVPAPTPSQPAGEPASPDKEASEHYQARHDVGRHLGHETRPRNDEGQREDRQDEQEGSDRFGR